MPAMPAGAAVPGSAYEWRSFILCRGDQEVGETVMQRIAEGWELMHVYSVLVPMPGMGAQTFVTVVNGLYRREKG